MAAANYSKDPTTTRSYTLDYAEHLAAGATIQTSTWTVPAGLTLVSSSNTATSTEVKISGGTSGTVYAIYNDVHTSDDLSERRAIILQVVDAAFIGEPSDLEKQLADLRVAISQAALTGTAEYQIGNRMKRRYSLDELLNYEKRLVEQVNAERRRNGGTGIFKNHLVRPVEPGP
jgi:hypothetical protein